MCVSFFFFQFFFYLNSTCEERCKRDKGRISTSENFSLLSQQTAFHEKNFPLELTVKTPIHYQSSLNIFFSLSVDFSSHFHCRYMKDNKKTDE